MDALIGRPQCDILNALIQHGAIKGLAASGLQRLLHVGHLAL
jgi:hypothetical protein